jgi:hypothetical protein
MRYARFVHQDEHQWTQSSLLAEGEPAPDDERDAQTSANGNKGMRLFELKE